MVSDAQRRRLAALEQKVAPASQPDPEDKAVREAVGRIFEVIRVWQGEVNNALPPLHKDQRNWRDGPPDLFERIAPEDREVFQHILDVDKTF